MEIIDEINSEIEKENISQVNLYKICRDIYYEIPIKKDGPFTKHIPLVINQLLKLFHKSSPNYFFNGIFLIIYLTHELKKIEYFN